MGGGKSNELGSHYNVHKNAGLRVYSPMSIQPMRLLLVAFEITCILSLYCHKFLALCYSYDIIIIEIIAKTFHLVH